MKKRYLITALIVLAVIASSIILIISSRSKPHTATHPPQIEKGSATATVGLNNTDKLADILLPEEFAAVSKALSNYIHTTYGESVLSADVVPNSTKVNPDGSIVFSVSVPSSKANFNVLLQRPNSLEIDFSIPGSGQPPISLFPFSTPQ